MTDHDQSEQERARQLVHREVRVCLSSLVSTLAEANGAIPGSTRRRDYPYLELFEQAFELASPIQDYEEAAIQAGWSRRPNGEWARLSKGGGDAGVSYLTTETDDPENPELWVKDAQSACETDDLEPYEREVYEFWAVSDWFGRKLREQGEKVDFDFANLTVWARTTTGQAIYCDGVVERIVRELWRPEPIEATSAASSLYEIAARKQGWQWDEGGSHFFRNHPGASAFEPYEFHTTECDWAALCLATDIDVEG